MIALILCAVWLVLIPLFLGIFRPMVDDVATHATAGVFWPAAVFVTFIFFLGEWIAELVKWVYRLGERVGNKLS